MEIPECPYCKSKNWKEGDCSCDDCGSHSGYVCQECNHCVDTVWDTELYDKIEEALFILNNR